jgi:hypothetical protein
MEKLGHDCKYDELDTNTKHCMENFYYDALNEFVNSEFYSKNWETDEYHFPVLFGDDGAFTDSHYNFKYIDKLIEKYSEHS